MSGFRDIFLLQGVVAVLSGGTVDVLCHAAVRARNAGVLLAACRSAAGLEEFRGLEGQLVAVEAVRFTLNAACDSASRLVSALEVATAVGCMPAPSSCMENPFPTAA